MKRLLSGSAVLAIALAGCGSDEEAADAFSGPAGVMPADTPIYVEATIRPEGEQADDLDTLLSELGELPLVGDIGDPGDLLIGQLESQAEAAGIDFSYADDVEPWLGEKAGIGISAPSADASSSEEVSDSFVAAVETTDEEAARDSIDSLLAKDESVTYEEDEYEGVSYVSAPGDTYRIGVFDGHVVLAPPDDFEASVDASQGESLAASEKVADSLAQLDESSLVSLVVDLDQLTSFASTPGDAEEIEQAKEALPEFFDGTLAISAGLSAGDQIYLDYVTPLFDGQPEAGASPLLDSAPGDSLGAFALADVGSFGPPIADLFQQFEDAGADLEDFPEGGIAAAFEEQTGGISFDDATAAIGDASLWVRGDLPDDLEVAGEIQTENPDVAAQLIDFAQREIDDEGSAEIGPPVGGSSVGFSALEDDSSFGGDVECTSVGDAAECLPAEGAHADLPFVNIELDGDKIRYGFFKDEAAAQASDPDAGGDFSDTEAYGAGQEALGDDFNYIGAVDLEPILDEFVPQTPLGAIQEFGSPEDLIGPFIAQKLGVVAFGVRYEDDAAVQRYVLKLAE
jgi:hypothetical protein